MVRPVIIFLFLTCVSFAQTTNRIVYEQWLDSLATVSPFKDSIISITSDTLINYSLISDLDSLATISPFKDSIISIISDTMYLQEDLLDEDLRFPVSAVRLAGSNVPASTLYLGGEVLSFPTNADATIYFEAQIPHHACDMRVDSIMFSDSVGVHIHCIYSADGTNPDSVRWVFTYTWANMDGQFPTQTTVNKTVTVTDRVDSTHYLEGITYINSTNKRYSSMLLMSLTRDVSEDDYGGAVYLLEVDIHYLRRDYYNDF